MHHPDPRPTAAPRGRPSAPLEGDDRPSNQRFRIEIDPPSRRSSLLRNTGLLLMGALNLGDGPTNPGGRRARIVDVETGEEVAHLLERLGDAPGGVIAEAQADLRRLDVASFAARWLEPSPPEDDGPPDAGISRN